MQGMHSNWKRALCHKRSHDIMRHNILFTNTIEAYPKWFIQNGYVPFTAPTFQLHNDTPRLHVHGNVIIQSNTDLMPQVIMMMSVYVYIDPLPVYIPFRAEMYCSPATLHRKI
jgi:hypothetical protein